MSQNEENNKHILIDLKDNETTIHYAQKITKAKYDRNRAVKQVWI